MAYSSVCCEYLNSPQTYFSKYQYNCFLFLNLILFVIHFLHSIFHSLPLPIYSLSFPHLKPPPHTLTTGGCLQPSLPTKTDLNSLTPLRPMIFSIAACQQGFLLPLYLHFLVNTTSQDRCNISLAICQQPSHCSFPLSAATQQTTYSTRHPCWSHGAGTQAVDFY